MIRSLAVALQALVSVVLITAVITTGTATPTPHGSPPAPPAVCPVTQPNGDVPPGSGNPGYTGGFGNDALWTNLWMWGKTGIVLTPNDAHVRADGAITDMKWAWYRYVSGTLVVEGRRLDAPAPPLEAWVPEGYGDVGFQVTGLTFPTTGCWEITGRVGEASLAFVLLVQLSTATATPVADHGAPQRRCRGRSCFVPVQRSCTPTSSARAPAPSWDPGLSAQTDSAHSAAIRHALLTAAEAVNRGNRAFP